MKTLKSLALVITLTLTITLSVFAGEVSSPPCPTPDPGEMNAPPCSGTQLTSDDPTLGQTGTLGATAVTQYVVVDTTIGFVENVLSLF